jgi:hypothetical protein
LSVSKKQRRFLLLIGRKTNTEINPSAVMPKPGKINSGDSNTD